MPGSFRTFVRSDASSIALSSSCPPRLPGAYLDFTTFSPRTSRFFTPFCFNVSTPPLFRQDSIWHHLPHQANGAEAATMRASPGASIAAIHPHEPQLLRILAVSQEHKPLPAFVRHQLHRCKDMAFRERHGHNQGRSPSVRDPQSLLRAVEHLPETMMRQERLSRLLNSAPMISTPISIT